MGTEITIPASDQLQQQLEFSKMMMKTGFLPPHFRDPAQVVAVILMGKELGLAPMHAIRSITVIQGKPTMSAELIRARFVQAGGKIEWKEVNSAAAMGNFSRNGSSMTCMFTMKDAEKAQLTRNPSWQKYPAQMLIARCSAMAIRSIAPDVMMGVYTPEELGAIVDGDENVVEMPKESTSFDGVAPFKTIAAEAPKEEPSTVGSELAEALVNQAEPIKGKISAEARKKLSAALDDFCELHGITEPEDRKKTTEEYAFKTYGRRTVKTTEEADEIRAALLGDLIRLRQERELAERKATHPDDPIPF